MFFLSALSVVIGIVSGLIGIYLFIESRKHPAFQRPWTVFLAITAVMLLLAFVLANIPSSLPVVSGRGVNPTSTLDNSHPPSGVTQVPVSPTPTPTPSPTPTPLPKPGTVCQPKADEWPQNGAWQTVGTEYVYREDGSS